MKMIPVTVQLPEPTDRHYRREAKRRFTSKAALIREVLIAHVQSQTEEEVCPPTQLATAQ